MKSTTGKTLADFPELLKQWHPTKNGELVPEKVAAGSHKKRWWKCPVADDHEWSTQVQDRTRRGSGCPYCSGMKASVTNSLESLFPDIAKQWFTERNGKGPDEVTRGSSLRYWWKCPVADDHVWQTTVSSRTISGTGCPCCAGKKLSVTNSLVDNYPEVVKQWHPTKNKNIELKEIIAGSSKRVWWLCSEGHEWCVKVWIRVSAKGTGCKRCSKMGKKITPKAEYKGKKVSDIPRLFTEWHPTKNSSHEPSKVTYGSAKKIWWLCSEGHEWVQTPNARTAIGLDCPYCGGSIATKENSLAGVFPELAAEWHPTKNGELTAERVLPHSQKKYWWKCPVADDHEWEQTPGIRANPLLRAGCPCCSGNKVSVTNSLVDNYPDIAKQWHPTKNKKAVLEEIVAGSGRIYWWKCSEGPDHEWEARVADRAMGRGCSICAGQIVVPSTSLATKFPILAKEWHPDKNGKLTPHDITPGSVKEVWWRCSNGHEWPAVIYSRTGKKPVDCPHCTIVGKSKFEIRLAHEIDAFVETNLFSNKMNVDIFIQEYNLAIEFDGHFWHENRYERDCEKTKDLIDKGFNVIRIREEPLPALPEFSKNDIFVKQNPFLKDVANEVLQQIEKVCSISIPGLDDYLKQERPINKQAADEYIATLQRDEQQSTLIE